MIGLGTILYLAYFPIYTPNRVLAAIITIAAFVMIVGAIAQHKSQLDSLWGEMTYATYLVHYPLRYFLGKYLPDGSWSIIIIGLFLTYGISYFLVVFIERPMELYRHQKINHSMPSVFINRKIFERNFFLVLDNKITHKLLFVLFASLMVRSLFLLLEIP